ncbi:MAG: hypothetical protein ACXAB9_13830 [Candidatus Thorarchaeota archaeon]|jgi:hypothetical protein
MGSKTIRDAVTGVEYTITAPHTFTDHNPCAEQKFGFAGDVMVGMDGLQFNLEGVTGMREWIKTDDEVVVNMDHIVSYSTDLEEISPELSAADIWDVMLTIVTVSGDDYAVTDLDELIKFVRSNEDSGAFSNHDSTPGSLGYYVKNFWRHQEMKTKAEKLNG